MNMPFSIRSRWVFHNGSEREKKDFLMRIKVVLGIWLLGITLAWMAVAPADLGVSPLVDAQGVALGWWQLRQHAMYLSGLWSISLMALVMLLALRLPLLDRVMGGMDQVYRLHKWTGIAAALSARYNPK
jgi:predicted ferric reductase